MPIHHRTVRGPASWSYARRRGRLSYQGLANTVERRRIWANTGSLDRRPRALSSCWRRHLPPTAFAWFPMSASSRVATVGETTAPSRMEQSVDVGGALLQFVLRGGDRPVQTSALAARPFAGRASLGNASVSTSALRIDPPINTIQRPNTNNFRLACMLGPAGLACPEPRNATTDACTARSDHGWSERCELAARDGWKVTVDRSSAEGEEVRGPRLERHVQAVHRQLAAVTLKGSIVEPVGELPASAGEVCPR